ncbi:S24/S26 family peptidase [Gordonia sp. GONU]|uniref:S24/S26 family peptidase n=1 Tax=Gordonia TaxID=2053 RepID=UPI0021ABFC22|nr:MULTISPECIES: S24/S26 family peptidase [Gordonia]MCR8898849.1 S24/S26 family peptidase [Gordonia sp. GONU]MCZ4650518.1 S24/S26 family peptidase [Gordonia amicalis]
MVVLIATVVSLLLGVRPVIFETGSMAPAISTGSLGLSRAVPAVEVRTGDVVSVIRDDGVRVTHRVIAVEGVTGNSATLALRGDANDAPDPRTYVVTEVDRVYGTVPVLGYVAAWLKNPYTLTLQALAALALLAVTFAPKRGWRNSPAGQRILAGTAAATAVALVASGTHGGGEAKALTAMATATGTVTAGPTDPTSFLCTNIPRFGFDTVTLSWPNPPENSRYTYVLSFGSPLLPDVRRSASAVGNPAQWEFPSNLFTVLGGFVSEPLTVELTNTYDRTILADWVSDSLSLQIEVRPGDPITGIECVSPVGARSRNAPSATESSESVSLAESSESPTPSESSDSAETSVPQTTDTSAETADPETFTSTPSEAPALPPGGVLNDSGAFAYYQDGSSVTIRDTTSTDVVYDGRHASGSSVRWLPGTSTLEITDPDGTVTTVQREGSRWVASVEEPQAPAAQTAESGDSSESTPTPATTSVPSVPSADEPADP